MTRQIKVRVWNGIEMVYDVVVGKFGAFYVNPGAKGDGLNEKDTASLTPFNTIYSKETPVMEFTGLKDKNGKEIYEGDLFHCIYHSDGCIEHELKVVWYECGFRMKRIGGDCHQWGVRQELWNVANYEIIGNIYQNPELLK